MACIHLRKLASKEEISALSHEYLVSRNAMLKAKMQKVEIEAAIERGEMVQKRLVEKQSAFLLISLRQKILAVPDRLARQLVNVADVKEGQDDLAGSDDSTLVRDCQPSEPDHKSEVAR